MFPAQTIHRWGYGTGCLLFALESPRRCFAVMVYRILWGIKEEKGVPLETTAERRKETVEQREGEKERKGTLLNMMSV